MQYLLLIYDDETKWGTLSEAEQRRVMKEFRDFTESIVRSGHYRAGDQLQPAATATSVRGKDGKALLTDGPYAETKEQIGGILILEASDLNHAIQLMSKHPGVRAGPFEIRPVADLTAMIRDSERRRTAAKQP